MPTDGPRGLAVAIANSIHVVKDESLIDEMREAVRADRERAEIRRHESQPAPIAANSKTNAEKSADGRNLFARLARLGRHG